MPDAAFLKILGAKLKILFLNPRFHVIYSDIE